MKIDRRSHSSSIRIAQDTLDLLHLTRHSDVRLVSLRRNPRPVPSRNSSKIKRIESVDIQDGLSEVERGKAERTSQHKLLTVDD